jgi:heme-degrading monooxygenase HmoA
VIVEIGLFRIDPRRAGEFDPVAADIRSAFERGGIPGLRTFHRAHSVEDVGRLAVLVCWESVDDHRRFVSSTEEARQRELLEGFMTIDPDFFHLALDDVAQGLL